MVIVSRINGYMKVSWKMLSCIIFKYINISINAIFAAKLNYCLYPMYKKYVRLSASTYHLHEI